MAKLFSVAGAIVVATLIARAQTPAPAPSAPTGIVVGSGNFFSPIVGDLEKAVAFYRDGLGLDVMGEPSNADNNPALRNMFGVPDAQIRWQIGRPPAMRTGVEIVEIKKAQSRAPERRIQDPGAFWLIVLVRDLDAAVTRLKQVGAPVVTRGGGPIKVGSGNTRAIVVRDPDGHFVEVAQLDPLPETAPGNSANVLGVRVRLTVDNLDRAMGLYRDVLGLQQTQLIEFAKEPSVLGMFGLAGGEYRYGITQVPGSGLMVEFIEFRGVDRRTVQAGIQDPGSTRMQLQVRDVDAAIAALKSRGGAVASTGGEPVNLPGRGGATTKVAIVRDPNNLFLVLLQAPRP